MVIYLDNAATTPLDEEVFDTMAPFLKNNFGNASSTHSNGRTARAAIEQARKSIAGCLNCTPAEIIFTSGGTEADNLFLQGAIQANGIGHIITSPLEHHAVFYTVKHLAGKDLITMSNVDLDATGIVNLDSLEQELRSHTNSIVALMHANNEIGNLLDLQSVSALCQEYGAIFYSDTVQTIGHYPLDIDKIKIHGLAGSAHKVHGPKGSGFMYLNHKVNLHPMVHGGEQERAIRGGTENVAGIIGLAKAIELAYQRMSSDKDYILSLKSYMIKKLKESIPGLSFNGDSDNLEKSLYTVLNVSFPEHEVNDVILFTLDLKHISVSGGSACASGSTVKSHVLDALNIDHNRGNVRFSFSRLNTVDEIDQVISTLKDLYS